MHDTVDRARSLARMKTIAVGLLVLAALVYAVATALASRHPAWAYVAAFAEAAMVGAMADWFAVVALFRHPLGLPIPHTAIIPANKSRIGANLANFICNNFLATPQVLDKLRSFDPAARLANWLAEPAHAAQIGEHLVGAVRYGLGAFDDEQVREFLRRAAVARLQHLDVAQLAGRLLDVLTADRRHQRLLDGVLHELAGLLDDEAVQSRIAAMIAGEVEYLRYVGLDKIAGKVATRKIVAGVARLIGEMSADESHPLRQRFDVYTAEFIERLKGDASLRTQGEALRDELLAHPALGTYLHGLWNDLLTWLHTDLARPDSAVRARVAEAALTLGDKLRADRAMQAWINRQCLGAAPPLIERYREDIRRYIVGRVDQWDTAALTREVELNIGRDLQFVRLNGTLVGGLIGLLIHALTQWLAHWSRL